MSNKQLLRETQMRLVTCIVHEHQLRLYEHVAHFLDDDSLSEGASGVEETKGLTTCLMVAAG